jgi:hypothetical protein
VDDQPVRNSQQALMMEMRAARMVRVVAAALSLSFRLSLVVEIVFVYI